MAARRKRRSSKTKTRKRSNRSVSVKAHYRSPRGADKGKPRVRVPAYRRRKGKDQR